MNLFTETPPTSTPAAKPVKAFRLTRKGKRLTIRVHLAAGVIGRITVSHRGKVVRRFVTGGRATFRIKVARKAKVVLRAERNGKIVKRMSRKR